MSWNEDNLHRWLAAQPWPLGLEGSRGHDAAVLPAMAGRVVICADQCIEGVHFEAGSSLRRAGAKAVLRSLSDLAATAASPVAVTLTVRAPEAWADDDLQALILGAREAAVAHGAELVAGDLALAAGPAGLSVSAMGRLDGSASPVGRDRAVPGQRVLLTGPVGGSLASGRHLEITPRLQEGRALWQAGATAMMDVSDGLAVDLYRLARASGVAIELEAGAVPIHRDADVAEAEDGRSRLWHALHDGEDHELVACIAGQDLDLEAAAIGRVVEGAGLWLIDPGGRQEWRPDSGGWIHGGGPTS